MDSPVIFSGAISVKAALESGVRPVKTLYVDRKKDDRDVAYILRLARSKGVDVTLTDRETVERVAQNTSCGGICAEVGERTYATVKDLLSVQNPLLVLLEGVEDPYNFGEAVRSAYAAGATGLVVPSHTWAGAEDVVCRTSAGASERLSTVAADDLAPVLDELRAAGVRVLAADRRDAVSLYDADLTGPVLLCVGGRLRGLSRTVSDRTDRRVYIPYGRDFKNSLTAPSACAVLCFEALRQRGVKEPCI